MWKYSQELKILQRVADPRKNLQATLEYIRSRKRREQEHDNKGRKGKRDLRTKFTEDSSISQAMLETAQECVDAMNNEVAGLQVRFARTSQEAKEKLQQEKPAISGSGVSHK